MRHAVRRDGSPLRIMPAHEFTTIADDDLGAIVGYIRSVPPVAKQQPDPRVGPIIRALFLAGQVQLVPAELIDHARPHEAHVEPEVTPKYGKYLAIGCTGCHGPTLSGGKVPGAPPEWKPRRTSRRRGSVATRSRTSWEFCAPVSGRMFGGRLSDAVAFDEGDDGRRDQGGVRVSQDSAGEGVWQSVRKRPARQRIDDASRASGA